MADEQNAPEPVPTPPAAIPPRPTPAATSPKPTSGGSPLKVLIPIVALVAVVFGVTFVSQYTPRDEEKTTSGPRTEADQGKHPLRFGTSVRNWDWNLNNPDSLMNVYFPGFYEPGEAIHSTTFWLENRNSSPVSIQAESRGGPGFRLADIPGRVIDELVLTSILSGFPQGPVSGLPLAFAAAAANLDARRLEWQSSAMSDVARGEFKVAAANPSRFFAYQWSIFELSFQVRELGKSYPAANIVQRVDATGATGQDHVQVMYEGMDAFDLSPAAYSVGELSETSEPKSFTVVAYSCTRGPYQFGFGGSAELAPPQVKGDDSLVTVSAPVKVPTNELIRLSLEISNTFKNPKAEGTEKMVRVDTAYRYTVTVKARSGDHLAYIGDLTRAITFELPGTAKKQLNIKGTVRGPIWLENNLKNVINLPSYQSNNGIIQSVRLVTEQPDAEVQLVPAECSPPFVRYEVKKLPPGVDRGLFDVQVTVPENQKAGAWSGTIVLEMKGPRPQRIRIPVHGTATR